MADSTRKRRWFAFRLRTLLIIVTLVGCVLLPFAVKLKKAREQRKIVEWVLRQGGTVTYLWQSKKRRSPTGPKWLRKLLGDEFFQTVISVRMSSRFSRTWSSLNDVAPLGRLKSLEELYLAIAS